MSARVSVDEKDETARYACYLRNTIQIWTALWYFIQENLRLENQIGSDGAPVYYDDNYAVYA